VAGGYGGLWLVQRTRDQLKGTRTRLPRPGRRAGKQARRLGLSVCVKRSSDRIYAKHPK